jgi:hypothetical protein
MNMLKPVIVATALFAIAGSSFVYAQDRSDGAGGFGHRTERHHRLGADDINAFADARIAALKAGLELTPDQSKNWPAFETALRNMVQLRLQRMQARAAARDQSHAESGATPNPATPFDRMAGRADTMSKRAAALKQLADAGGPLYQSLDDAQKSRFAMLSHILRPRQHDHANAGDERDGRGWGHGRRFGERDQGGRDGEGWGRGRRFSEDDGSGPGHRRFDREDRGMHGSMDTDNDQDDSRL